VEVALLMSLLNGGKSARTGFEQANREALYSVGLALIYMAWWYFTSYGAGEIDTSEYSYILGFPSWFFLSCIAGYLIFSAMAFLMVHFLFREISLDGDDQEPKKGVK